jgi:hypothetical protein
VYKTLLIIYNIVDINTPTEDNENKKEANIGCSQFWEDA